MSFNLKFAVCFLLLVSFNAISASYCEVDWSSSRYPQFQKGDTFNVHSFQLQDGDRVTYGSGRCGIRKSRKKMTYVSGYLRNSCPEGTRENPENGVCESVCEFGAKADGSCKNACEYLAEESSGRTLSWDAYVHGTGVTTGCYGEEEMCTMTAIGAESCSFGSNGFSPGDKCSNKFKFTGSQCDKIGFSGGSIPNTSPEDCVPGNYNYPKCLGNNNSGGNGGTGDPTKPINPPSGGFNPDSPDKAKPSAPSFNKDTVDDVKPTDKTDKAVLEAIQNQNRDANQAATAINKDLNAGFADVKTSLSAVEKVNQAIGKKITEQTVQDKQIYDETKKLMLEQIKLLREGSGDDDDIGKDIKDATKDQTEAIEGAIKGLDMSGHLNAQTEAIKGAIDNLSDKFGKTQNHKELRDGGCNDFTCSGDDITCYIARQSWQRSCADKMDKEKTNEVFVDTLMDVMEVSESAYDENGALVGVVRESGSSVDSMLDAYTQSNGFHFQGGCPSPRTFSPLGATFTIDYQPFCDLAIVFRVFIMASAALASFLMIAKYI